MSSSPVSLSFSRSSANMAQHRSVLNALNLEAIRVHDKIIVVLSPESLRSKWVMNEVRRTRKAELANNQRKFFPIALMDYRELNDWECIDPETGTDLAAEIREYFVPDFRDWKNHDRSEKAFAQLLDGLK